MAEEPFFPVFERDIFQHAARVVDDGIVDHDIDASIALDGELDEGCDVLFHHDITAFVGDLSAEAFCGGEHLLRVLRGAAAVADDDGSALAGEGERAGFAQPQGCAGDDGHFAC